MLALVPACAGIVLACVGMCRIVLSCAELFSQFGPIQTHPSCVLQLVETCGNHWRLVRHCRFHTGSKLPAAPARSLPLLNTEN